MKLISCYIENFGCLHAYRMHFHEGMNVLCEDNGFGKTTLAAFIKAMLYGLPVSKKADLNENERKKYTPWNPELGNFGGMI
ncbi:MAG: AAA family ATPase, partial [Clostridia bacterium]|nr:AAA family ATPase [Clostridia bacterium]